MSDYKVGDVLFHISGNPAEVEEIVIQEKITTIREHVVDGRFIEVVYYLKGYCLLVKPDDIGVHYFPTYSEAAKHLPVKREGQKQHLVARLKDTQDKLRKFDNG